MARNPPSNDPIPELESMCRDIDGTLHPEKVREALTTAYRRGFNECNDIYRGRMFQDPMCSVARPEPVFTPAEQASAEARIRAELGIAK